MGATCNNGAPPATLPAPATRSAALFYKLPSPISWAPLSPVAVRKPVVSPPAARRPVWCPSPARRPATARGPPHSAIPAAQLSQDRLASGPGAVSLLVVAPHSWALDPVGSSQWAAVLTPSHPEIMHLTFTVPPISPLEVASLLLINCPVDPASTDHIY